MSDFDLARQEAAIRLADAARALDAVVDRLRVEAFNTRVCAKLALASALEGTDVPNEEMLLSTHAAIVEVDGIVKQAYRSWQELSHAAGWWSTVHLVRPFYPDLQAFYEGEGAA